MRYCKSGKKDYEMNEKKLQESSNCLDNLDANAFMQAMKHMFQLMGMLENMSQKKNRGFIEALSFRPLLDLIQH